MASVPRGVTIRLFLVEGVPDGLWTVEKSNWTGIGLMCPRSSYPRARLREELARPGVYVLAGPSDITAGRTRIYVGEADVLSKRLDQHYKDKDFWTRAVVFTSKDQNLNKAHVRSLESRLIRLANDAGRAEVENGNAPAAPSLSESEAAEIDAFLEEMLSIYPVLDLRAFDRVEAGDPSAVRLFASGPNAKAEGAVASEGFVVFSGSTARAVEVPSATSFVTGLRAQLIAEGVIAGDGPSLRFTRDYLFSSPSAAASAVLARNANGRTEWKDAQGRTLHEIEAASVARARLEQRHAGSSASSADEPLTGRSAAGSPTISDRAPTAMATPQR